MESSSGEESPGGDAEPSEPERGETEVGLTAPGIAARRILRGITGEKKKVPGGVEDHKGTEKLMKKD